MTRIEELRAKLPDDNRINDLCELFKMFGDPTRTKILSCLQPGGMRVGEIAEVVRMSVSAVSHQLRLLRGAKLVRREKQGKEVFYFLDDDHVTGILEFGLSHIDEERT